MKDLSKELMPHQTLVAQWKTKGNDWLILYKFQSPKYGTCYGYIGPSQGGGVEAKSDEEAIKEMERSWGADNKPGAGAAFVMKCDRPSLKRVA